MTNLLHLSRFLLGLLMILLLAVDAWECPDLKDACMTDENWNYCREIHQSGCQNLVVMESCPLQFACGDDGHRRSL